MARDEQHRHQTARIGFGVVVPNLITAGNDRHTPRRSDGRGSWKSAVEPGPDSVTGRCRGLRPSSELGHPRTPNIDQVQGRPIDQLDRGDQP